MMFSRSRAALWVLLAVLALAAGVGLAKFSQRRALKAIPAAYLIALDDDTRVRLRWKTRRVQPTLTLTGPNAPSVPEGKKVVVVYPNGKTQVITGPQRIQFSTSEQASSAKEQTDFLSASRADLLAQTIASAEDVSQGTIRITSPVGVTRFSNPEISWTAKEGVKYDVALIDPADEVSPPRVAKDVRPPLHVSDLQSPMKPELPADRIQGVLVRIAGATEIGGGDRFLVSADATNAELPKEPADLLVEAINALAQKPARTGDAWTAISHLPENWKHNQLVARVRVKLALELGLPDELAAAKAELKRD